MNFKAAFQAATAQTDNGSSKNLEKPVRQQTTMSKRKRDSSEDESSSSESDNEEPQILTPIGILPKEQKRINREYDLSRRLRRGPNNMWVCKYCAIGDGKIGGLTNFNMKIIYALEQDNRWKNDEQQFIRLIVNKYNELVYQENIMRTGETSLTPLTYEEYEYHLAACGRRNAVAVMWKKVDVLEEEIDFMRTNAGKYKNQYGSVVIDNKTNRTIDTKESTLLRYLKEIENIENREKKDREKEKQKLRTQLARSGSKKGFYEA